MLEITPDDLLSEGAALAARARLEGAVEEEVDTALKAFVEDVRNMAGSAAEPGRLGSFTLAAVVALWVAATQSVRDKLSPKIGLPAAAMVASELQASTIPDAAFEAGSAALAQAAAADLSRAAALRSLSQLLGTSRAEEFRGRFTVEGVDESSYSWEKAGESAARTASTRAAAVAMIEKLRAEGYTHKRWMTRYDSRVRESHANVDRTTIELDASFVVGGSSLRYPADPFGAAAEIANCRCLLVGVRYGRHALDHPEGSEPWNNPRPF